ncbi:MAG: PP2C family protein-serine/threonine phosphatase [Planctomycetota bacterium]
MKEVQCTEVWGGAGACDVSVKLAGARGECFSKPFGQGAAGGDIHYLSVCGMGILSKVVLADVSGHGEESAEVARIIHESLIENIGAHDNSSMLRHVNESFLKKRKGAFKFTTMVSTILDSRDRSLVYAYAGHPAILRGAAATGRFSAIEPADGARGGMPLGILSGTEYAQHAVDLDEGDVFVLYSDAFTEAPGDDGELLGIDGFCRLLEGAGSMRAADIKNHVMKQLGPEFDDDASLVVLEVL